MKPFILKVACAVLLTGSSIAAKAQEPAPQVKEAEVRELLTLTGQREMMLSGIREMIAASRETMPNVPPEFWSRFLAKAESSDVLAMVVPVYQRHLTPADLQVMLAFYRSEAGKRLIQLQPKLFAESVAAGKKWGEEIGRQVGFELMLEEAAKKMKAKAQL